MTFLTYSDYKKVLLTFHSTEGPIVIFDDGSKHYFIEGKSLTEEVWLTKVLFNEVKIRAL